MSDYVKFRYERAASELAPFAGVFELNACRQKLLERRLIGVDSSGISFGNISMRDGVTNNFYITGSGTGGIRELVLADCAKVVACDFGRNSLRYEGSTNPSSESFTHAAIYEADARVAAVIHCHDSTLWAALLNEAPTTSNAVAYGSPEMAYETMRLFRITDVQTRKILVMAGHEGGIVTFGGNLEEAFTVLMHERNGIVSLR
ncbi:MAG TPA: class II aldolase/adducin family protein [Terriglobales bacterium]|nr:class II aldolase/adducin family protein [Terriglobales bacterium]